MQSDRTLLFMMPAVLLGVGLTVGLFIWPNYRAAEACEREVADLYVKIETLEEQARMLDQLQDDLAQHNARIENDLKQMPESADLASLMRKLSQDVDRVTVLDQTFTAGSATELLAAKSEGSAAASGATSATNGTVGDATVMAMPLTVDMESTFDAVLALIRNAETLNRLVRIANVRLTCKRDEAMTNRSGAAESPERAGVDTAPVLKASVMMEAIYQPEASVRPSENSAAKQDSQAAGSRTTVPAREGR